MDNDALNGSLTARVRVLEDTIVQLRHEMAQTSALAREAARAEAIFARAHSPEAPPPSLPAPPSQPPHVHARPRNPHGWGVIRGGLAALLPLWLMLKPHRHAAAAALAAMTMAGATGLAVTANIANSPGRALAGASPHVYRRKVHHHHQRPVAGEAPVAPVNTYSARPAHRHHHRDVDGHTPRPSSSPSPVPSPASSSPGPSPGPTVTPVPSPSGPGLAWSAMPAAVVTLVP